MKKAKFLKSAALAVAGVALATSVSSCSMMGEKHSCAKNKCSKKSKHSCSKNKCSKKHSCSKSGCGKK